MELENNNNCCGCGVCESVCPNKCIERSCGERKSESFFKGKECVQCGLCDDVCPLNKELFHDKQKTFYKAKSINPNVLSKSSSGGVVHEVASAVIAAGGIVYGAAWNYDNQRVEHIRILEENELSIIQGSKYVQSIITPRLYNSIKKDLYNTTVLFIGTPCEVAAVRSFTKDHDNLVCVDLICHGVPSYRMFADQLKTITETPIKSVSFRDRCTFRLLVNDQNNTYEYDWEDSPYYSLYMHFASLREYCYHCKYACNTRVGDITAGDYIEKGKGYSCVVLNTKKGETWFGQIKRHLNLETKDIELLKENHAFNQPTQKHPYTDKFSRYYNEMNLEAAYKRVFIVFRIKRKLRLMLGDQLYSHIKRTLGKI